MEEDRNVTVNGEENGDDMPVVPPTIGGDADDDTDNPELPPAVGGDDNENFNDNDSSSNYTPVNYTETTTSTYTRTTQYERSSIFGYVQSLFEGVMSRFGMFSGGFFGSFMPGFGRQPSFGRGMSMFGGQNLSWRNGFGLFGQSSYENYSQTETFTTTQTKSMTLEGAENREVWLSNESEQDSIDATETSGNNILAGNNKNNQIFGGSGNNDMWGGGAKTNDLLVGGTGKNNFWYGKGEGIDLVENAKQGDTINLYNITIGDISNVEITDNSISLVVGDSEGIGVSSSDNLSPNFKLANGETYNYNRSSAEWQRA
jgi:hypothetical protein